MCSINSTPRFHQRRKEPPILFLGFELFQTTTYLRNVPDIVLFWASIGTAVALGNSLTGCQEGKTAGIPIFTSDPPVQPDRRAYQSVDTAGSRNYCQLAGMADIFRAAQYLEEFRAPLL